MKLGTTSKSPYDKNNIQLQKLKNTACGEVKVVILDWEHKRLAQWSDFQSNCRQTPPNILEPTTNSPNSPKPANAVPLQHPVWRASSFHRAHPCRIAYQTTIIRHVERSKVWGFPHLHKFPLLARTRHLMETKASLVRPTGNPLTCELPCVGQG